MLIFLFHLVHSQFIQDGIRIIEKGMKLSLDNYLVNQNCPASLNIFCNNPFPSLSIQEQETLNFVQLQVQQFLESLEPKQNKHQYYNKIINQLFQEIVLYDQNEEFLSFAFKFSQFYPEKDFQLIQEKYYIDSFNRSAILMDNNNNSMLELNTTLFMNFQDLYTPSSNNILNHILESVNVLYPPDRFNIRTADKKGCIYFTKPIYLSQFYVLSYNANSKIRINYDNNLIKVISIPVKNQWILVFGPNGYQVNNITIPQQTHIDSLVIQVQKQPYTKQQITVLVVQMIMERYYELNSEDLLNLLNEDEDDWQSNQEQERSFKDQLYQQTIKEFLEFLEKVLAKINQQKIQNQFLSLSSEQIIVILQDIEKEISQNEILIFQSLFQNFINEKYSENDIVLMYIKLVQISEELQDINID
ncbi:unnamed protein product (macronuclear) [Paramecium tetraurelia]|uniref:Uncharacterized protein n=1 Tax=Paramecium tetraurelia TaxID=5888 RepID=A0DBQ7_PARTE|nr:uncharacterized protein GSPATT00015371001 [Paramecium tetraurelia]CAK80474.1 unnamed protein product [Paramecium tetraurelia]|eukprot:XP_001447871.1 hypothetical protein (macronuclear) [Paramecium tetraurelia strain d4-2]